MLLINVIELFYLKSFIYTFSYSFIDKYFDYIIKKQKNANPSTNKNT